MTKLTPNQIELLQIAKEKGFVTIADARQLYSTINFQKNALERMVQLGLLEVDFNHPHKFKIKK